MPEAVSGTSRHFFPFQQRKLLGGIEVVLCLLSSGPVPELREGSLPTCPDSVVFTSAGPSKAKEDADLACALTSSPPAAKRKMLKKGQYVGCFLALVSLVFIYFSMKKILMTKKL